MSTPLEREPGQTGTPKENEMDREIERAKRLERELKQLTETWGERPQLTLPQQPTTPTTPAPQGAIRG